MRFLIVLLCILVASGCGDSRPVLRVAVTTSIRDSGLIDEIVPAFEQQSGVRVDVLAAGTGNVLKLGEDGNVDVVWVHARTLEEAFMAAGHGIRREDVMHNHFQLLGPPDDPAGIRGLPVAEALRKIHETGALFVSRGDNSGTHLKELDLWRTAYPQNDGTTHPGLRVWSNYLETGQGMGASLIVADQKQAYVLADRGTFLHYKAKRIDLIALADESSELRNDYGIIVVNPAKHAAINEPTARQFVDYVISAETQQRIADFEIDGESLFSPAHVD